MTKTVNINLAGTPFTIDEPAYRMLEEYLDTLQEVCDNAGQPETAADIEQRIAEIFSEQFSPAPGIIGLRDVEKVIARIGSPGEIVDIEIETDGEQATVREKVHTTPPPLVSVPMKKRFFRDTRGKMLGGVCAGLAWYIGIDVVWVRLIAVALCFLSVSTMAIVYIILWIVVPEATTPLEQMQMMGMESTVSNVGKVVTENYPPSPGIDPSSPGKRTASTLNEIFVWIAKFLVAALIVAGIVIACSLLLALGLGLLACMICLVIPPDNFNLTESFGAFQLRLLLGCIFGGTLFLGIPLILAVRALTNSLSKNKSTLSDRWKRGLLIAWIIGTVLCTAFAVCLNISLS